MENKTDNAKRYYHGTPLEYGLAIGKSGFILSPWHKEIEDLKREGFDDGQRLSKVLALRGKSPDMTLEDLALELASCSYRKNFQDNLSAANGDEAAVKKAVRYYEKETIERVKSISFTRDLRNAVAYTGQESEGIVLSFEIYGDEQTIFVPERISLENNLKEVFIAPGAVKKAAKIREVYDKYHPRYFRLKAEA